MVVDQLILGEDFWTKTSTFLQLPARKEKENAIFL